VTAQLAGLIASIKYTHPDWNWFDIKAALRMTAANFATGYDPRTSGYGVIHFQNATMLTDAGQLPLFPPAAVMRTAPSNKVVFAVNSFKQTRRTADALFQFRTRPFPLLKELTLNELTDVGGHLLYTGDLSETTNSLTLHITANEPVFFVWLSKDARGLYSRIEPYSILGPVQFPRENKQLYGPRINRQAVTPLR
jgi:hypothetical protein